jgi:hypothetical protein
MRLDFFCCAAFFGWMAQAAATLPIMPVRLAFEPNAGHAGRDNPLSRSRSRLPRRAYADTGAPGAPKYSYGS